MAGQADGDRTDDTVRGWDRLPTTITRVAWGWSAQISLAAAISSSAIRPWRRSKSQSASVAAQLLAGQGAELVLDVVEVCFQFGYGTG